VDQGGKLGHNLHSVYSMVLITSNISRISDIRSRHCQLQISR